EDESAPSYSESYQDDRDDESMTGATEHETPSEQYVVAASQEEEPLSEDAHNEPESTKIFNDTPVVEDKPAVPLTAVSSSPGHVEPSRVVLPESRVVFEMPLPPASHEPVHVSGPVTVVVQVMAEPKAVETPQPEPVPDMIVAAKEVPPSPKISTT